jgi:hypothetical protein
VRDTWLHYITLLSHADPQRRAPSFQVSDRRLLLLLRLKTCRLLSDLRMQWMKTLKDGGGDDLG